MKFYKWLGVVKNITKKEYRKFHETKKSALRMEWLNSGYAKTA